MDFRDDRREQKPEYGENRRKGPDIWIRVRRGAGVAVWFVVLGILYIMDSAKPENTTFFDRLYNIQRRETWNSDYNMSLFLVVLLGFFISVFGLYINSKRNRRKSDKYPLSLIIMFVMSTLSLLGFVVSWII